LKKIGRYEKIIFTSLNEGVMPAKIDTGAFNAALHVDEVKIIDSGLQVRIKTNTYIFHKWSEIEVKSSNGKTQKRFGINLKIQIGKRKFKIFVSLTNRKNMKFPILIGRNFLHTNNFIVDVSKKNIYGRPKKI